tara:strand:- start:3384 stop:3893 length:510 start_codon:yes stop_codon:yes gene_type:complete
MITKTNSKNNTHSIATYSDCGCYRYSLSRVWEPKKKKLTFVLLNPSTATELQNDPTVERCERRARTLGFGGFLVCNIFAWRDTSPEKMKKAYDPIGNHNDNAILDACVWGDTIICAWGTHGSHLNRGEKVLKMIKTISKNPYHLGLTKAGYPKHPLYISYNQNPIKWKK